MMELRDDRQIPWHLQERPAVMGQKVASDLHTSTLIFYGKGTELGAVTWSNNSSKFKWLSLL